MRPPRTCYGNQFGLTFPVFVHCGVELWGPEVGGRVDPGSDAQNLVMSLHWIWSIQPVHEALVSTELVQPGSPAVPATGRCESSGSSTTNCRLTSSTPRTLQLGSCVSKGDRSLADTHRVGVNEQSWRRVTHEI